MDSAKTYNVLYINLKLFDVTLVCHKRVYGFFFSFFLRGEDFKYVLRYERKTREIKYYDI